MDRHISDKAKIGSNVTFGFNTVICEDVIIGDDCSIGHNVVIHPGTQIGKGTRIDDNSIIGKKPLSSPRSIFKLQEDLKPAVVGEYCQIGANVIIYVQSRLGDKNLVADMATIRENVTLGDLNIIGRNATIENYCEIGNRNKFETNCYITAYSQIEDYCFIAPCVTTSNDNYMGRDKERFNHFKGITIKTGGRIGANSTVLPGKTINEDGMVAAASVVTRDVPENTVVLGSPARLVGEVTEAQRLKNNLDK